MVMAGPETDGREHDLLRVRAGGLGQGDAPADGRLGAVGRDEIQAEIVRGHLRGDDLIEGDADRGGGLAGGRPGCGLDEGHGGPAGLPREDQEGRRRRGRQGEPRLEAIELAWPPAGGDAVGEAGTSECVHGAAIREGSGPFVAVRAVASRFGPRSRHPGEG